MEMTIPTLAGPDPVVEPPVDHAHSDSGPEDSLLATRAQGRDEAAFGALVERYGASARRVARSILGNAQDADDAAQDAFLLAWSHMATFDARRPFRPWLMRIVVNAATDLYRRRKVRHAGTLPDTVADSAPSPERETDRALLRERLREALAQLTDRQRAAVTMFDAEGYSHQEIATVLDVPVGTVRSLVFHARRALRASMAPFEGGTA